MKKRDTGRRTVSRGRDERLSRYADNAVDTDDFFLEEEDIPAAEEETGEEESGENAEAGTEDFPEEGETFDEEPEEEAEEPDAGYGDDADAGYGDDADAGYSEDSDAGYDESSDAEHHAPDLEPYEEKTDPDGTPSDLGFDAEPLLPEEPVRGIGLEGQMNGSPRIFRGEDGFGSGENDQDENTSGSTGREEKGRDPHRRSKINPQSASGRKKKKKHPVRRVILIIVIILAVLIAALYAAFRHVVGRTNYVSDADVKINSAAIYGGVPEDESASEEELATLSPEDESVIAAEMAGVETMDPAQKQVAEKTFNLLLIGSDRRTDDWYGNSDAMILLTFNPHTSTIYMTSFMRDLYARIPGVGVRKLNAAHAIGGGPLLVTTLKENYGVDIDHYASVDFQSLAEIIDMAGGVDVQLNTKEAAYLNNGLTGRDDGGLTHLNGTQAVAYARIRYVGNSDFERTSRQREVLSSLLGALQSMSTTEVTSFIYDVLPYITHNMTDAEILRRIAEVPSYLGYQIQEERVPFDGHYTIRNEILIPDMNYTIPTLQSEIYAGSDQE